jgi:hypothetical protein
MFTKTDIAAKLDAEINSALDQLKTTDKMSEEYGTLVDRISKLHKLKSDDDANELKLYESESKIASDSKLKPPSLDTVLVVAANLFGILLITRYEREDVINTKSLGFIMKPR